MKQGRGRPAGSLQEYKSNLSLAEQLFALAVGEKLCLIAGSSADRTMKDVQSALVSRGQLKDRKYKSERWLLVRENEKVAPAVIVTRTE